MYVPDLDSFQKSYTEIHGFLMHMQELSEQTDTIEKGEILG